MVQIFRIQYRKRVRARGIPAMPVRRSCAARKSTPRFAHTSHSPCEADYPLENLLRLAASEAQARVRTPESYSEFGRL
jgi:hypothetical protein